MQMLGADLQNRASCLGGEHIFIKIVRACHRKMKNVAKIMADTLKCRQNKVGCMKMSSKLCLIHH